MKFYLHLIFEIIPWAIWVKLGFLSNFHHKYGSSHLVLISKCQSWTHVNFKDITQDQIYCDKLDETK
jgi:hypothetical protein